ncbi:MAG: hypothetical protein ACE5OO_06655 [Candidatus Bathyarchaeia archaeon]
MTHTHHRRGSRESLKTDFVVLSMIDPAVEAQQTYGGPLGDRIRKLLAICGRHGPVALAGRTPDRRLRYLEGWEPRMDSGIHRSSSMEEIITCEDIEGIGHAVYTDAGAVEGVLKELKEADLGISIVVSGVFEEVFEICRRVGIEPHTVNMSLGTWGRTELMPKGPILELCTMCGHAMISSKLVETAVERVKKGFWTPDEAAVELGKQCTCNIFNTVRAAEIIKRAAGQ